jgi:membrane protein DedA with SNARE-associated domain
LVDYFLHFVDVAGYPGLFVVMILGNLGMPVGTEFVVPAAGALAATGHLSSVWLAGLVATLGEVVGASLLYAVGRYGGPPFVHRYGKYVFLRAHELQRVHRFYERYGTKTVFICRFIPVIRGIASLPAGLAEMPKRYFLPYTAAGSAIFCFVLAWAGHSLGSHVDRIAPYVHRFSLIIAVAVVAAIAFLIAKRFGRGSASEGEAL